MLTPSKEKPSKDVVLEGKYIRLQPLDPLADAQELYHAATTVQLWWCILGPRRSYCDWLRIMHSNVVLTMLCLHNVFPLVSIYSMPIPLAKLNRHCRRDVHRNELEMPGSKWGKLFEDKNGGYLKSFQPFFGYLGGVCTLLVVFFFNTASLWNGTRISVKATAAFVSPPSASIAPIFVLASLTRNFTV